MCAGVCAGAHMTSCSPVEDRSQALVPVSSFLLPSASARPAGARACRGSPVSTSHLTTGVLGLQVRVTQSDF